MTLLKPFGIQIYIYILEGILDFLKLRRKTLSILNTFNPNISYYFWSDQTKSLKYLSDQWGLSKVNNVPKN